MNVRNLTICGAVGWAGRNHRPLVDAGRHFFDGSGGTVTNVHIENVFQARPRARLVALWGTAPVVEHAGWKIDRDDNRPPNTRQWIKRLHDGAQVTLHLWPDETTRASDDYARRAESRCPCH